MPIKRPRTDVPKAAMRARFSGYLTQDDNLARAHEGMREARAGPFHHLDVKAIAQGAECFIKIKEWFDA